MQSRREPDDTGLAWFDADGRPRVDKQPLAAYEDRAFAREARDIRSETFLAHIRYASTGGLRAENTHPFEQRGRVFAHNGVIEGLDRLATPGELWALRYPDTHGLFVLHHGAAGPARHLDAASAAGTVRVRSADLAGLPAVIVASEPMDADPAWRALQPGELLHVDADLRLTSQVAVPDEPRHRLTLADLAPNAAQSQAGHPAPS